jgi:hypothetical protein
MAISNIGCSQQATGDARIDSTYSKREKWNYFESENRTKGVVLYYKPAEYACGKISTASITIVKLLNNDTIRVISICNTAIFKEDEYIDILPVSIPLVKPILPSANCKYDNIIDALIKKTTYAIIVKQ